MKKFLSVVIAVVLCLAVALSLTACNKNKDWQYIEGRGEMIIAYTVFVPMNYEEGGKLVGFDTELAEAVCKELGVKPIFKEIVWDNKDIELKSKKIDCIWNGFTYTEERAETTDFSIAYLYNKQIAVTKASNSGLYKDVASIKAEDALLIAEQGSAGEDVIIDTFGKTHIAAESQVEALRWVKDGKADVAIVDSVMAEGTLATADFNSLTIVDNLDFTDELYAIGFRKNSPKTLEKVNAALKKLWDDGTIAALAEKYNITESLKEIK